ncbi:inactive rhomboid protein 1-like isoform X2 [Zophobas morio]|jgi:membrane associated rhomboid family serine protease|uniref:inactive rhomboid protein 1-like isoform X2 n=1 Tax=Zophobas morio TaxID=2755281 RepID=UPI003083847B
MLTKKEITVIGDNFRLLDFDGDLKLSYSEALSLYHAVKSEIAPNSTASHYELLLDDLVKESGAFNADNVCYTLDDFCQIFKKLKETSQQHKIPSLTAPEDSTSTPPNALKTIISAAESAATWFGVSSKPGGASEWGLRAGAANTDDLLGDMDAGEEQLLNQSSGLSRRKTMSIRRRLTRLQKKRKETYISIDQEKDESGVYQVEDQAVEDEKSEELPPEDEETLAFKEKNVREIDTLLTQAEDKEERFDKVRLHTRSFLLHRREQYKHTVRPTHYAYARWFESEGPILNAAGVPANAKPELHVKYRLLQPRKQAYVKRPLVNPPPVGKPALRFNRQGQKLKVLSKEAQMIFAARPRYRPWINYISIALMIILMIVEIGVNLGVEPIGVGISSYKANIEDITGKVTGEEWNTYQNMWIGVAPGTLIHLGAKYTPCMKRDNKVYSAEITQRTKFSTSEEGCCLLTNKRCWQTSEANCKAAGGMLHKGSACSSLSCEVFNRPCCIGTFGQCENIGEKLCKFYGGHRYDDLEKCSEVPTCLSSVCGMGGISDPKFPCQWWRFILPMFYHAGIVHLVLNILFQVTIGFRIESECGPLRFFLIFLISGIGGNIVSGIFSPYVTQVGSSGALYGLMSILVVELGQNWRYLEHPYRELIILGVTILISLGIGTLPYVDNYAHFGGFLYGLFAAVVFLPYITFGKHDIHRKRILLIIFFPLLILMLAMGFYTFSVASDDFCGPCQYINCIPYKEGMCNSQSWDGTYVSFSQ